MKQIFLFAFLLVSFFTVSAQKIDRWGQVPYSGRVPTGDPKITEAQVWFNVGAGDLYTYNRNTGDWSALARKSAYAEMSISNDTSTISFAATTAAPIQDLTVGPISGFTMVSDSLLRYDGEVAAVFQVSFSGSILFAEAANIIRGYVEVNGTEQTRARFRQTMTLVTENETVAGSALLTLNPGALVRFMFVPSTHTGTDILSIYQFNLNLVQVN